MFGIPVDTPQGLAGAVRASPRLRWVQATSAGAGEQVHAAGLSDAELARVTLASASGVHAGRSRSSAWGRPWTCSLSNRFPRPVRSGYCPAYCSARTPHEPAMNGTIASR